MRQRAPVRDQRLSTRQSPGAQRRQRVLTHRTPSSVRHSRSRCALRRPRIAAARRAFLLSFVITQHDPDRRSGWRACQGAWSGRGSALVAPGSSRRRWDSTTARVPCLRSSRRHAVAATSSAAWGASVFRAVASARCSQGERLGGVAAGDQVTVTDSHHAALRMTPGCSSRRQCPRATCTRSSQRPWPARGAGLTLLPRMLTIVPTVSSFGIIAAARTQHATGVTRRGMIRRHKTPVPARGGYVTRELARCMRHHA